MKMQFWHPLDCDWRFWFWQFTKYGYGLSANMTTLRQIAKKKHFTSQAMPLWAEALGIIKRKKLKNKGG